jgi:hypothetical protein
VVVFLVEDSAQLDFEVDLIQLRLRVRARLFFVFPVVAEKLLVALSDVLFRLLEAGAFLVDEESQGADDAFCGAVDVVGLKLPCGQVHPFPEGRSLNG